MYLVPPKLRGAVVGFGFISGQGHVPAYLRRRQQGRDDVEIVAVADICEARRQAAHEILPRARIYADYRELLACERLDFVDICTPPCDHPRIAHAALERGLHVLCEKPLAPTAEEALALLAHARSARRVLFPCHNYKHAPVVRAVRDEIAAGTIGPVHSVTLNTFRNTHAKGVPEWKTHWRRERRYSGGGIAMDHGSHTFYLAFEWMGSYPTAITAKMTSSPSQGLSDARWDTEDSFSAVLTFPNGLAHAHLSWTSGVRKVIYTIQGRGGAITVEDDQLEVAVMSATGGRDVAQGAVRWDKQRRSIASHWMDASHVEWFDALFEQFKTAIARGECVGKEAQEACLCVQLIGAAYRSAQDGCREQSVAGGTNSAPLIRTS